MRESEAAVYLKLNVRTLQRYRTKGTLAFREAAGKTRATIEYDQADLDRLKAVLETKRASIPKPHKMPKTATERVSFGLAPEGYAELVKEAERFDMSVGEYARRLVREGLESRFQSEAAELRTRILHLETELSRTRTDFAAALEVVLEYTGLDLEEAQQWVAENLR